VSDLSGEVIDGRYQLTRIVASGGMATIYAALDLRL
jgi:serine/threonine-protein kinase